MTRRAARRQAMGKAERGQGGARARWSEGKMELVVTVVTGIGGGVESAEKAGGRVVRYRKREKNPSLRIAHEGQP